MTAFSGIDKSEPLKTPMDKPDKKLGLLGFRQQKLFFLAGDLVSIIIAELLFRIRDVLTIGLPPSSLFGILAGLYCFLPSLYVFDMYNIKRSFNEVDTVKRSIMAALLGWLLSVLLAFSTEDISISIDKFLQIALLSALFAGWRCIYSSISQTTVAKKSVLIIGMGDSGKAISDLLSAPASPYRVKGFVDHDTGALVGVNPDNIIGSSKMITEFAGSLGASDAILALPRDYSGELRRNIVEARLKGTIIHNMADIYEHLTGRVPVEHIRDEWFLSTGGFRILHGGYLRNAKRLFDLIISAALLIPVGLVILFVGFLIRIDSCGPVFYKQARVGKGGKRFYVYKLRSMRIDAESQGAQWATSDDPRVTRIGKWLRLLRVDEVPQLWNVFRGDMSLVGPRPERPEFVTMLEQRLPYYHARHCVKPGLTGWAQITFQYAASIEDSLNKLEADLYYIKNMSLMLDCKILLKTIGVVFLQQGAR